jgi:hypothetical protein
VNHRNGGPLIPPSKLGQKKQKMDAAVDEAIHIALDATRYRFLRSKHTRPEQLDEEIDKEIVKEEERKAKEIKLYPPPGSEPD